jgi:hypothetical protein
MLLVRLWTRVKHSIAVTQKHSAAKLFRTDSEIIPIQRRSSGCGGANALE